MEKRKKEEDKKRKGEEKAKTKASKKGVGPLGDRKYQTISGAINVTPLDTSSASGSASSLSSPPSPKSQSGKRNWRAHYEDVQLQR